MDADEKYLEPFKFLSKDIQLTIEKNLSLNGKSLDPQLIMGAFGIALFNILSIGFLGGNVKEFKESINNLVSVLLNVLHELIDSNEEFLKKSLKENLEIYKKIN